MHVFRDSAKCSVFCIKGRWWAGKSSCLPLSSFDQFSSGGWMARWCVRLKSRKCWCLNIQHQNQSHKWLQQFVLFLDIACVTWHILLPSREERRVRISCRIFHNKWVEPLHPLFHQRYPFCRNLFHTPFCWNHNSLLQLPLSTMHLNLRERFIWNWQILCMSFGQTNNLLICQVTPWLQ